MCYGIPVGSPQYVRHELSVKVHEVAKEVEKIVSVMEGEGQAIWTILRSSTAMKLDYHLSLCYPSDMLQAAKEMDNLLWLMLERASGLNIPRLEEGRGVECCPAPPVRRIHDKSYQDWITRTPVRLGGMGMRSMVETSILAFIGGVEQALPNFVGEGGVCQQLAPVLGDMSNSNTRWQQLLASGSRTGEELTWAWETLRQEAMES